MRLQQFDAIDHIDILRRAAADYERRFGAPPRTWQDLIKAGYLRRPPGRSAGHVYVIDADRAVIAPGPLSPLNPLPIEPITIDRCRR